MQASTTSFITKVLTPKTLISDFVYLTTNPIIMKRIKHILILCVALCCTLSLPAQKKSRKCPDDEQRKAWYQEMLKSKIDFLAKDLQMTEEQKPRFSQIYTEMQNELARQMHNVRSLERNIESKGDAATDADYEKCADAMFEMKQKEGAIDMKYLAQLKKVLSKKQLYKLKQSEMKWSRKLMKHRHKRGAKNRKDAK